MDPPRTGSLVAPATRVQSRVVRQDTLKGEDGKDTLKGGGGKKDSCNGEGGKDSFKGKRPAGCEKTKSI